jgi:flagellar basal body rod protein FlgB
MNVLDKHLAPHANALQLRQKRLEVIGANIANAATPNYKACCDAICILTAQPVDLYAD